MDKRTFIKEEVVNGDVKITTCGNDFDVVLLGALTFANALDSRAEEDCTDSEKLELGKYFLTTAFEEMKKTPKERTTIDMSALGH